VCRESVRPESTNSSSEFAKRSVSRLSNFSRPFLRNCKGGEGEGLFPPFRLLLSKSNFCLDRNQSFAFSPFVLGFLKNSCQRRTILGSLFASVDRSGRALGAAGAQIQGHTASQQFNSIRRFAALLKKGVRAIQALLVRYCYNQRSIDLKNHSERSLQSCQLLTRCNCWSWSHRLDSSGSFQTKHVISDDERHTADCDCDVQLSFEHCVCLALDERPVAGRRGLRSGRQSLLERACERDDRHRCINVGPARRDRLAFDLRHFDFNPFSLCQDLDKAPHSSSGFEKSTVSENTKPELEKNPVVYPGGRWSGAGASEHVQCQSLLLMFFVSEHVF